MRISDAHSRRSFKSSFFRRRSERRHSDRTEWIVILVLSVLIVAVPISTVANSGDPFAVALEERMPALLRQYRVPGAMVSYIKNGDVVWTKAFGRANLATGAPMQPDMVFNHGSNGKVLTAWGIMRLVEEGKVSLDAPCQSLFETMAASLIEVRPQRRDDSPSPQPRCRFERPRFFGL